MRRSLLSGFAALLTAGLLGVAPPPVHAAGETYSAPLTTAISSLQVATEVRTGYSRDKFPHWVDADGDGCSTRFEVLDVESETSVTCSNLSGGRWFSYYDRVSWTDPGRIDIDHVVALAEAWDSGARSWTTATRQAYANDLGDYRTLVGVTDSVNQSKGDQDPTTWMPTYDRCRYLREWVAVKIRWRLSVDSAEKSKLESVASGCTNSTITVVRAR